MLAHDSRVKAIITGKAWRQECGTAAHIAPEVRKQRGVNAGAQLALSVLIQLRIPAHGMVPSTVKVCLPTSLTQLR